MCLRLSLTYLFVFALCQLSKSQVLPGLGPTNYCIDKDSTKCEKQLTIYANSLYSLHHLSSLDYSSSVFCLNDKIKSISMNLGQILFGDQLKASNYSFNFNEKVTCGNACIKEYKKNEIDYMIKAIRGGYKHEWMADNLPVLICSGTESLGDPACSTHFFAGCMLQPDDVNILECDVKGDFPKNSFFIFNHMHFDVTYRGRELQKGSFIGQILSIKIKQESRNDCQNPTQYLFFDKSTTSLKVSYTYSIEFHRDDNLEINTRLNYLYNNPEYGQIRWASIAVSLILVIALTGVGGFFFVRAVRRDILRYTELLNSAYDNQEDYGWKLLKGDVFRSPKYPMVLAITVGSGVQILLMTLITLFFACIGFFAPSSRGSLITCVIVLFVLLGGLSGYVSARIYKFFDGEFWKTCLIGTALLHPGIIFFSIFIINLVLNIARVNSAIPFLTLFALFALWTLLSIPLAFVGSIYGFKARPIKCPVRKNMIPRSIPRQRMTSKSIIAFLFGSFICFISIYLQLYFIIRSIWLHHSYFMFGLLFCVVLLLTVVCSEVAIIFCYIHLCSEDYRWQWRSFFTVSLTSIHCLCYVIAYYTKSSISSSLGAFIYFSYSLIMLYMLFLAAGAVGFLSCFYVLLKIFSSIKVD